MAISKKTAAMLLDQIVCPIYINSAEIERVYSYLQCVAEVLPNEALELEKEMIYIATANDELDRRISNFENKISKLKAELYPDKFGSLSLQDLFDTERPKMQEEFEKLKREDK